MQRGGERSGRGRARRRLCAGAGFLGLASLLGCTATEEWIDAARGVHAITVTPLVGAAAKPSSDPGDLLSIAAEQGGFGEELRILPGTPGGLRHLVGGWSRPERWQGDLKRLVWCWSSGAASRVRFLVDVVSPIEMSLRAVAFQPPGGRPQRVELLLNEQFVGAFALEGHERLYEFSLPAGAVRTGENILRFQYQWTEQPARVLPGNSDSRELAMAMAEIVLRRPGAANPSPAALVEISQPEQPSRRGLLQHARSTTSRLIWPVPGSELEVSWAVLPREDGSRGAPRYRIVAAWDGAERVLVEGRERATNAVHDARVALPPEAPAALRLRFEVESESPGDRLVWIEPRIVKPAAVGAASPPPRLPAGTNVLLIVLDAAQRAKFGVYGAPPDATPVIDALSRESLVFDAAYAPASYTIASTASLLTSRFPYEHGLLEERDRLTADLPTLPEVLGRSGYATAVISGNPYVSPVMRMTRGFDRVVELFRDQSDGEGTPGDSFIDPFQAWLDQNRERPFFAYLHLIQPHEPYDLGPAWCYEKRVDSSYAGRIDGTQEQMRAVFDGRLRPDKADEKQIRALYEGNLCYADHIVGVLIDRLRQANLLERTLVIVSSDHGESLGERGIYGHGSSLDREQIKIPLIVRFPSGGVAPGRRSELVSSVDLMPTILALLGIEAPPDLRGRCWFSLGSGETSGITRVIWTTAEGRAGTVSAMAPGFKYTFEQATGRERLLGLPEEEDGPNLRWDHPVTFAFLASEASRALAPRESEQTEAIPADVKDALRALGYGE